MPERNPSKTSAPPKMVPGPTPPANPVVTSGPFAGIPDLPATHDAMFKVLAKACAAALLRACLPERYRGLVDFDKPPVVEDSNHYDEALRLSQSDVLLKVYLKRWIMTPDGKRQDFAHVLLEHKSWVDPAIVLQLEGYRLRVLKFYAEAHRSEQEGEEMGKRGKRRRGRRGGRKGRPPPLPLFISLVFYHGSQEWTAPTSLREMFRHQDAAGPEIDGLQYILIDLGRIPLEALAGEPEVWAVAVAMRFATRDGEGEPYLAEIYKALAGNGTLQRQVEHYIISNWAGITEEALMAARAAASRETGGERTMQTLAEKWTNEGVAKGEVKGMANMVIAQMRHRFNGRLSERDEARVAQGSAEELGLWGERLLTADSPETVFDPGSQRRH